MPLSERLIKNGRQGSCLSLLMCDVSNITATVAGLTAVSAFIFSTAVCLLTSANSDKQNGIRPVRRVTRQYRYSSIAYTEATGRSSVDDGGEFVGNFFFAPYRFITFQPHLAFANESKALVGSGSDRTVITTPKHICILNVWTTGG